MYDGTKMEKSFTVSIQPMEMYSFLLARWSKLEVLKRLLRLSQLGSRRRRGGWEARHQISHQLNQPDICSELWSNLVLGIT
jgi:hypothetical protein